MDYRSMIPLYLETQRMKFKDPKTEGKYHKQLSECVDMLERSDAKPDENFFNSLHSFFTGEKGYSEATAQGRLKLARKFFAWCALQKSQKGDDAMTDMTDYEQRQEGHDDITSDIETRDASEPEHLTDVTVQDAQHEVSHEEDESEILPPNCRKRGRPQMGTEARTKKITVYLTPSLERSLRILANLDEVTVPNFIFGLIQNSVNDNADDINAQFQLQEKRKARNR